MTNVLGIFDYKAGEGIHLIYTSDCGQYWADGKSKGTFTNPLQVVADANTDGSPSGYWDKMAVLRMYHIKDGDLKRLVSTNWGGEWGEETTVITGQDLVKAVEMEVDGRQYCFAIDTSGNFYCYQSNSHFDDGTWTLGTNKFLITTGVDTEMNPGRAFSHGVFWVYCYKTDARRCYKSTDFGKSWTEVASS